MRKLKFSIISLMLCLSLIGTNLTTLMAAVNEPGVTVSSNTDYPESDANYQVKFTYQASDNVTSVSLIGGFTFYTADQEQDYVAGKTIVPYSPYEYKTGMFPTGYAVSEYGYLPIPMENIGNNLYTVTIPLPGSQYFYGFELTYSDGTKETVKDPTNMPFKNGDSDSGWSLVYVGNSDDCLPGQEYVYPRNDGKTGKVNYVNYTAVDGSTQPLGIYLPANYDTNKTYKTIYLAHGGGGNEVEWMNIGSASNIMDNLIADGEVAEAIVVTMDNTYFNFEKGDSLKNLTDHIIPYIEKNYNVSTDSKERALCGLSSGATVTVQAMLYSNETFGYYGVFSPSRTLDFVSETLTPEMKSAFKNAKQYYVSVGIYDTFVRRDVNVQVDKELQAAGANVVFKWKNGAHDWGVWRDQFTEFVKDYLWDAEKVEPTPSQPDPDVTEPADTSKPTTPVETTKSVKTGDSLDINGLLVISGLSLVGVMILSYNKYLKTHKS